MLTRGQIRQELLDLEPAHFPWMTHSMKADEAADPEDISLLGSQAVVTISNAFSELIQKPDRVQWQAICKGHLSDNRCGYTARTPSFLREE